MASAQSGVAPPKRSAQRDRAGDLGLDRLGADLELEEAEAFVALLVRFGDVLFRRRIAEEPHRRDLTADRAADEIDGRKACGLAAEVEQRDFDRRVGAAIAVKRPLEPGAERRPHPGILTDQQRRQMIANRAHKAAERVARHGRSRRSLAPADGAVLRFDPHQDVERLAHGASRHGDRLLERKADRDGIDPADDQRSALSDLAMGFSAGFHDCVSRVQGPVRGALPRTGGIWMNSQGEGIGPTGTSIKVGPSRRLNARLSAARSSCGLRARSASAPKLCA